MKYLTQIKLLALDVDGVLTDGIIYYSPAGDAMKGFSARDGMGISLARMAGLRTALITGRRSPMVEQRAKDLHIDYVIQDAKDKLQALRQLCRDKYPTWVMTSMMCPLSGTSASVLHRVTAVKKPAGLPRSFPISGADTAHCANW